MPFFYFFTFLDGYAPFLSSTSRMTSFSESTDSGPAPGQYDCTPVKVLWPTDIHLLITYLLFRAHFCLIPSGGIQLRTAGYVLSPPHDETSASAIFSSDFFFFWYGWPLTILGWYSKNQTEPNKKYIFWGFVMLQSVRGALRTYTGCLRLKEVVQLQNHGEWLSSFHTHSHKRQIRTELSFSLFGVWKEERIHRGNPDRRSENMHIELHIDSVHVSSAMRCSPCSLCQTLPP